MSRKKILIVDDSASVRRRVTQLLTGAGYEVCEADNGVAGAERIDAWRPFALVICDVHMPVMNGLDLLASVKSDSQHRDLPILMLTSEVDPELMQRARETGACGWLVKPFTDAQLISTVGKLTHCWIPPESSTPPDSC